MEQDYIKFNYLRLLLIIANAFGLIGSVFGMGFWLVDLFAFDGNYLLDIISEPYIPIFTAIAIYLISTTLFFSIYVLMFLIRSDIYTILNNRYILATFSLSVGGLFTPYILARMKNEDISSTISPGISISKGYGANALISGSLALIIYIIVKQIWLINEDIDLINIILDNLFYSFLGINIIWGIINCALFWMPYSYKNWEEKKSVYKLMVFVATINKIIATLLLAIYWIYIMLLIIVSILEILIPNKRGVLSHITKVIYNAFAIIRHLFILYTIMKVIRGLWNKNDKIEYIVYEKMENYQQERAEEKY